MSDFERCGGRLFVVAGAKHKRVGNVVAWSLRCSLCNRESFVSAGLLGSFRVCLLPRPICNL